MVEVENNFVGFSPLLIGIFHDKSNARRLNCQGLQNNSYFALSRTLIVLAPVSTGGSYSIGPHLEPEHVSGVGCVRVRRCDLVRSFLRIAWICDGEWHQRS